MHSLNPALGFQLLQIAPDRELGYRQGIGQVVDPDAGVTFQKLQNVLPALCYSGLAVPHANPIPYCSRTTQ